MVIFGKDCRQSEVAFGLLMVVAVCKAFAANTIVINLVDRQKFMRRYEFCTAALCNYNLYQWTNTIMKGQADIPQCTEMRRTAFSCSRKWRNWKRNRSTVCWRNGCVSISFSRWIGITIPHLRNGNYYFYKYLNLSFDYCVGISVDSMRPLSYNISTIVTATIRSQSTIHAISTNVPYTSVP